MAHLAAWYRKSAREVKKARAQRVCRIPRRPETKMWLIPWREQELANPAKSLAGGVQLSSIRLSLSPSCLLFCFSSSSANLILQTNSIGMWAARSAFLFLLDGSFQPWITSLLLPRRLSSVRDTTPERRGGEKDGREFVAAAVAAAACAVTDSAAAAASAATAPCDYSAAAAALNACLTT